MNQWAPVVERLELIPASGGRFEVTLDGELIYSKEQTGRHAEPGEISALVRDQVGEPVMDDAA